MHYLFCLAVCAKVFGTADAKRKEDEGKPGVEDSTDGPETPYTAGTPTGAL